jgi:outer membrane biosynthesis protein TonB
MAARYSIHMRLRLPFIAAAILLVVLGVRADEIKLKDGTKISGTIVGFEENSFRVKTSYGFAVVQKDQVLSISISDSAKKPEAEKKPEADKKPDADKKPEPAAEKSSAPAAPPKTETAAAPTKPAKSEPPVAPPSAPTSAVDGKPAADGTPPVAANAVPPSPSAPGGAPQPAAPEPMREEVSGNTYTNDTYGFQMYKPPDWRVIDGARSLLPGAITAMGTGDQTTYLLIGQEPAGKSLATDMDATEKRLREIMDNFRALGDKRISVSGSDGVERRFRGSVDQHDWSGIVAIVPHGTRVYTIFGMTYADTDLVQIQENVISRAISSLQFTKQ